MIKLLVITHGQLGTEMVRTAEGIVGRQDDVVVITLKPEDSLSTICQTTEATLKDLSCPEGVLVLTDMLGGTPCNACLPYCINSNIEIVSGINLYMLLSAFINRKQLTLDELVKKVMADAAKNIANAKALLLQKMR